MTFMGALNTKEVLKELLSQKLKKAIRQNVPFIDNETIEKHETYVGNRTKRGLFQNSKSLINADVNGSFNIMRKALKCNSDAVMPTDVGFVYNPVKIYL